MIKNQLLIIFSAISMLSCAEPEVRNVEIEGVDGERVDAKEVGVYDWNIFSSDDGKWISISKNGTKIVSIAEEGFAGVESLGRTVTLHSNTEWAKVELTDDGSDNEYEIIESNSSGKRFLDKGLDGEIDLLVEKGDPLVVKVNYKGELYPLSGDGLKKGFIVVNGNKIELERDGFFWTPIKKPHTKLKNASRAGTDAAKTRRPF